MQSRSSNNLKGVDISNHNGYVDMAALKANGIQIVYMKATEGRTYRDANLDSNYIRAKAAGLKVGFYHFFHANSDIDQQVSNLVNAIAGKISDCKIAIDVEVPDNKSASTITSGVIEFAQKVKVQTGLDCVIYTYTSFAKYNLDSRLGSYPVWIAHYGVNTPGNNGIWNSWHGFQYTDKGNIAGINGVADLNEFTPDIFVNSQPTQVNNNDIYKVDNLPYNVNAKIINDFFYVRDSNGTVVEGRRIDIGDEIVILDVSYSRELVEVIYPTQDGWIHGYIKNVPENIQYLYQDQYKNGSTRETIYQDSNLQERIGSLDSWEKATPLYSKDGKLHVAYKTDKGRNTKSGYVSYNGEFNKF